MFSGMRMFGAFGFDPEEETKKNEEMKREAELRKKYEENLDMVSLMKLHGCLTTFSRLTWYLISRTFSGGRDPPGSTMELAV